MEAPTYRTIRPAEGSHRLVEYIVIGSVQVSLNSQVLPICSIVMLPSVLDGAPVAKRPRTLQGSS